MWDLSSLMRDWTLVPCIARWILNHWITRKVSWSLLWKTTFLRPHHINTHSVLSLEKEKMLKNLLQCHKKKSCECPQMNSEQLCGFRDWTQQRPPAIYWMWLPSRNHCCLIYPHHNQKTCFKLLCDCRGSRWQQSFRCPGDLWLPLGWKRLACVVSYWSSQWGHCHLLL